MTAYLVNHQKKKRLLAKREQELLHAIHHKYSQEKLETAAEKVRSSKLGVYKAKFSKSTVLPASSYKPEGEALEWQNKSAIEIIDEYASRHT